MYLKLLGCKILEREISSVVYNSKNAVDVTLIRQQYHETPKVLKQILQEEIDKIDANSSRIYCRAELRLECTKTPRMSGSIFVSDITICYYLQPVFSKFRKTCTIQKIVSLKKNQNCFFSIVTFAHIISLEFRTRDTKGRYPDGYDF